MRAVTTVIESTPLSLGELARAVGAEDQWVVRLVEVEILHVDKPGDPPERWHFRSDALQRALAARRLERDFGANLDTAALILDLQSELRRMRALMHAHGLA
ncbi:MAG: MerR family transcriptional regulator [Burkholderiales bacterium]|jgi:chaperone modulatory protein CbpM|nr:MerR family transcriptional regulator [Burkholderiales bacterium]